MRLRTDGLHCRESAGTGPIVLEVVPVTGTAFSGITMGQFARVSLFLHPLLVCRGHDDMCDAGSIGGECWLRIPPTSTLAIPPAVLGNLELSISPSFKTTRQSYYIPRSLANISSCFRDITLTEIWIRDC